MQLSSGTHIPDGLLAANALLAENSRQGSRTYSGTLHQGFGVVISSTALGIPGTLYDGDVRSRCTGKEHDAESGNDYFGARYYGSSMGRFISPDWAAQAEPVPYAKLNDPQSLNLYAYVRNNPLTSVDVDGHDATDDDAIMSVDIMYHSELSRSRASKQYGESGSSDSSEQGNSGEEEYLSTIESGNDPAQQPLSSISVLGNKVGITYGSSLSSSDQLSASNAIGAAVGLINANACSLTDAEKSAIGQISSFAVVAPNSPLGTTGKGDMTLSTSYIGAVSAAWLGSLFGHEGQHDLNVGRYTGANAWRDEQSAGRTQLGIGNKIGFTGAERQYLENWIDDRNRTAMQQHMQQGYSY